MSCLEASNLLAGPIGPIDIDQAEFDLGFIDEELPVDNNNTSASLGRVEKEEEDLMNLLQEDEINPTPSVLMGTPSEKTKQTGTEEDELMNLLDAKNVLPASFLEVKSLPAKAPAAAAAAANNSAPPPASDMNSWGEWDVPLGRAQEVREFIGNVRFRDIIEQHRHAYHSTTRKPDKTHISTTIYNIIKGNGGRFLDKKKAGRNLEKTIFEWFEIPQEKALAKISQALRLGTRPVCNKPYTPQHPSEMMGYAATTSSCSSNIMPYYAYGEPSTLDMYNSANTTPMGAYYNPSCYHQQQQQQYAVESYYTQTSPVKLHSLNPAPGSSNVAQPKSR